MQAPAADAAWTRSAARYYLRFQVHDRPGVLARLAGALGEAGVSIEQMVQEGGGGLDAGCRWTS